MSDAWDTAPRRKMGEGGGGRGRDGRIEVERRVKEGGKERDRGGEEEDRKG